MNKLALILIVFQTLFGGSVEVETTLLSNQRQPYPCLAYVARDYKLNPSSIDTLFVSDFYTHEKLSPTDAFFVINSKYKSTCSKYPIFAFSNKAVAEKFIQHYGGAIRDFDFAFFVAQKDLEYDMPIPKARDEREAQRGKNIFETLCHNDANQCPKMNDEDTHSISIYLAQKEQLQQAQSYSKIEVPTNGKCPVCGMFVAKYPKWTAYMGTKDGHQHYFDGVKDMMEFYFAPHKYHHAHQKEDFIAIFVSDYYTLEKIEAKKSFFVEGSNIYGPMGHELIPFKNEADAKAFSASHNGKKIYQFNALTHEIIMGLDR